MLLAEKLLLFSFPESENKHIIRTLFDPVPEIL